MQVINELVQGESWQMKWGWGKPWKVPRFSEHHSAICCADFLAVLGLILANPVESEETHDDATKEEEKSIFVDETTGQGKFVTKATLGN